MAAASEISMDAATVAVLTEPDSIFTQNAFLGEQGAFISLQTGVICLSVIDSSPNHLPSLAPTFRTLSMSPSPDGYG